MDSGESNGFEPKIIAFCCHYCAFAAADLAGVLRLRYSPNVYVVRLPCTGKLDTLYLMKAFEAGADGVYVAGCLEGECHFLSGNLRAKARVAHAKETLKDLGIEPERLEFFNLSSAQGDRFAEIAREMTERIRGLGPLRRDEPGDRDVELVSSRADRSTTEGSGTP